MTVTAERLASAYDVHKLTNQELANTLDKFYGAPRSEDRAYGVEAMAEARRRVGVLVDMQVSSAWEEYREILGLDLESDPDIQDELVRAADPALTPATERQFFQTALRLML